MRYMKGDNQDEGAKMEEAESNQRAWKRERNTKEKEILQKRARREYNRE